MGISCHLSNFKVDSMNSTVVERYMRSTHDTRQMWLPKIIEKLHDNIIANRQTKMNEVAEAIGAVS